MCHWLLSLACALALLGQQPQTDNPRIDAATRAETIDALAIKLKDGYVIADAAGRIVEALRNAQRAGDYDKIETATAFVERLNADLRAASHDRHLAIYFDPQGATPSAASQTSAADGREHFNFGFYKIERLRGNVGYLDMRTFADLEQARVTAATYLTALANFDAIIIDLRQNGGGNTPMVAFVASYFLGPKAVHLTDIYWRDSNETEQFWTLDYVPGRTSTRQDLYLVTSTSTFSAAEDFCYALKNLKRATLVGEKTAGGAHSGRGIQRLTRLFTAFIPTGRSISPITKSNWEGVGVEPDVNVPADRALTEAHVLALRRLLERERDPSWQSNLRQTIDDLTRK